VVDISYPVSGGLHMIIEVSYVDLFSYSRQICVGVEEERMAVTIILEPHQLHRILPGVDTACFSWQRKRRPVATMVDFTGVLAILQACR